MDEWGNEKVRRLRTAADDALLARALARDQAKARQGTLGFRIVRKPRVEARPLAPTVRVLCLMCHACMIAHSCMHGCSLMHACSLVIVHRRRRRPKDKNKNNDEKRSHKTKSN